MRAGVQKLKKAVWYGRGGFSNPDFWRKAMRNGAWQYFESVSEWENRRLKRRIR